MCQKAMLAHVLAAAVLLLASPPIIAAGGIIFDDVTVKNGAKTIFFDDFNDGSIADWTSQTDAFTHDMKGDRKGCLWLDRQNKAVSCAFHSVPSTQADVLEVSAQVLLPPVDQQGNGDFSAIYINSGSTSDNMAVGIEQRKDQKAYGVRLFTNVFGTESAKSSSARTPSALVFPNKWVLLSIRMDRASGLVTAALDGKQILSVTFEPDRYTSIKNVSVWGWLGDYSDSTAK